MGPPVNGLQAPASLSDPLVAINQLWVYLGTSPLLWLALTVWAYLLALRIQRALKGSAWANPVMLAVLMLVGVLWLSNTPYATYFSGAQFVHFMLGTATVALAIPLRRQWDQVRAVLTPLVGAVLVGNVVGAVLALAVLKLWSAPLQLLMSIAPKSVTAPVAMGISEKIGGLPALTAVLVILTGILGATLATPLLAALRLHNDAARGLALGVAAHGIGTARAFQLSETAGTFAGVGMALSTLVASVWVPLLATVWQSAWLK
jgi:predicted murein hydrolase (TIGR00659 family)